MLLYNLLFYCALPIILLRLLWRGLKAPQYWQRWLERFAYFTLDHRFSSFKKDRAKKTSSKKKVIWLHAVSVGEVLASKGLVEQCLARYGNPIIVLTTMTPTGSTQVKRLFGEQVFHIYAPYDYFGAVSRFLNKIKPDVFLIMETEIWPNMVSQCQKKNIPVLLLNARLSEKSLKRYQKFPRFSSFVFNKIDYIFAQSEADKKRFIKLKTASSEDVIVVGNIKSDIAIDKKIKKIASDYRARLEKDSPRKIIIAASTHKGEDEIILAAYKVLKPRFPSLLLILVPRHPERFELVAELCQKEQLNCSRKSTNDIVTAQTDVLLADTMGELLMLYGVSDVAIMGGTFIEHGGHNPLEPAAWGLPIVSGNSDYNFALVSQEFEDLSVLTKASNKHAVAKYVGELLDSKQLRDDKRAKALAYMEKNRGALARLLKNIEPHIQKN